METISHAISQIMEPKKVTRVNITERIPSELFPCFLSGALSKQIDTDRKPPTAKIHTQKHTVESSEPSPLTSPSIFLSVKCALQLAMLVIMLAMKLVLACGEFSQLGSRHRMLVRRRHYLCCRSAYIPSKIGTRGKNGVNLG